MDNIYDMNFENEHIIDGMIYSHEIDKYVTIEEYIEYGI
tara:strand:+ start:473 stop:589 length:117 start_codon:yes stop_codon:yes gene_type:complete